LVRADGLSHILTLERERTPDDIETKGDGGISAANLFQQLFLAFAAPSNEVRSPRASPCAEESC